MSESHNDLDRQITELEQALLADMPAIARQLTLASLTDLRAKRAALATPIQPAAARPATTIGGDAVGGDKVEGDKVGGAKSVATDGKVDLHDQTRVKGAVVGVNQGTVQNFFGAKPPADAKALLVDYLDHLIITCNELRLSRILKRDRTGADRAAAPALKLQDVYTSLITDGDALPVGKRHTRSLAQIRQTLTRLYKWKPSTEHQPPEHARSVAIGDTQVDVVDFIRSLDSTLAIVNSLLRNELVRDDATDSFQLIRPELVFDAIAGQQRLVLLGEPGYGKSTVLRYLAHLLARRGRGDTVSIPGWPVDDTPVPVLLPLGSVAAALESHGGNPDAALWQVLGTVFDSDQGVRAGLRDQLRGALRRGGVLLLLDGLDELPAAADGGPRARVAKAIMRLVDQTGARVVVTSRVLPYRAAIDWQFPEDANWVVRIIQPLTFGQVRTFVAGWYRALVPLTSDLNNERADARANALITEIEQNMRLRPLVQSPLLLTMITLLHYNSKGNIPRDRARLYDECVQLLLERWEPVRGVDLRERPSRLQRLLAQLPTLEVDKLRDVIHELAFTAHESPPGDDGRGLINRDLLEGRLLRFFRFLRSPDPNSNVETLLEIIREEAGLLVARDDETAYAFPHLTFQEYLAACWLADQKDAVERAYARWSNIDRERWRQVLLLLAGRLRQKGQKDVERDGVEWIKLLSATRIHNRNKSPTQRRRDAVLAALSYAELGGRGALATSMLNLVQEVERPLRTAIVHLLKVPDSAIVLSDRLAAATVLGDLDDPRFPISLKQWCAESFPTTFGTSKGYWCYIHPGTYGIGGWDTDRTSADIALPAFWIARFPITVAQYKLFVDQGYSRDAERWWTQNGWQWKQERDRTQPWGWTDSSYTSPNQPVIGVTWYEAMAFCAWLNERLADSLPADYAVRLPTEAEWEVAAAFDGNRERRTYPWGADEPTSERAIFDESGVGHPAPVGCCPAGAAPCGALDLAGNVWEWTASSYKSYPDRRNDRAKDFTQDEFDLALRGGSWGDSSTYVRCGARFGGHPVLDIFNFGFRVVVAPRLAH